MSKFCFYYFLNFFTIKFCRSWFHDQLSFDDSYQCVTPFFLATMDHFRVMFVFFSYLLLSFVCAVSAASPVATSEELELLKRQVETLIEYREQDYNSLAASLKQSVEKNEYVLNLKSEIQNLR